MKNISKRNYIYVLLLVLCTILLTLFISKKYISATNIKKTTKIYNDSNIITESSLETFIMENTLFIVYIYDKYDFKYEKIENQINNKITKLNLKSNFGYLDKEEITQTLIDEMSYKYHININFQNKPIILIIEENELVNMSVLELDTSIDEIINLEVLK